MVGRPSAGYTSTGRKKYRHLVTYIFKYAGIHCFTWPASRPPWNPYPFTDGNRGAYADPPVTASPAQASVQFAEIRNTSPPTVTSGELGKLGWGIIVAAARRGVPISLPSDVHSNTEAKACWGPKLGPTRLQLGGWVCDRRAERSKHGWLAQKGLNIPDH